VICKLKTYFMLWRIVTKSLPLQCHHLLWVSVKICQIWRSQDNSPETLLLSGHELFAPPLPLMQVAGDSLHKLRQFSIVKTLWQNCLNFVTTCNFRTTVKLHELEGIEEKCVHWDTPYTWKRSKVTGYRLTVRLDTLIYCNCLQT